VQICCYAALTSKPRTDILQGTLDLLVLKTLGKTPAARRKLTMTDEVFAILKKRSTSSQSRYVFPLHHDPDRPLKRVHKAHYRAIERAGIKRRFILYDLRHTYGS